MSVKKILCICLAGVIVLAAVAVGAHFRPRSEAEVGSYTLRLLNSTDVPLDSVTVEIFQGDIGNGGRMLGSRSYENYEDMKRTPIAVGDTMVVQLEEIAASDYLFPAKTSLYFYLPKSSEGGGNRQFVGYISFLAQDRGVVDCELTGSESTGYAVSLLQSS